MITLILTFHYSRNLNVTIFLYLVSEEETSAETTEEELYSELENGNLAVILELYKVLSGGKRKSVKQIKNEYVKYVPRVIPSLETKETDEDFSINLQTIFGKPNIDGMKIIPQKKYAFSTVCYLQASINKGKWYYEVNIREMSIFQIGWGDYSFYVMNASNGVGDDYHSWSFDGERICKWNLKNSKYGKKCKSGDVLGCLLDIDNRIIEFTVNGESLGPAFKNFQYDEIMFPCMTFQSEFCAEINVGQQPFKHKPEDYTGVILSNAQTLGIDGYNYDIPIKKKVEDYYNFNINSMEDNLKSRYFSSSPSTYTCSSIDFGQLRGKSGLSKKSNSRNLLKVRLERIKDDKLLSEIMIDLTTKYIILLSREFVLHILIFWPIENSNTSIYKMLNSVFTMYTLEQRLQELVNILQIIFNTPLRTIEHLPCETRSYLDSTEYIQVNESSTAEILDFIFYSILVNEKYNSKIVDFFIKTIIIHLSLVSSNKNKSNPWIDSHLNNGIPGFSGLENWTDNLSLNCPFLPISESLSKVILRLIFSKKIKNYNLLIPIINVYSIGLRTIRTPLKQIIVSKLCDIFNNLYYLITDTKERNDELTEVIKISLKCIPIERTLYLVKNIMYFESQTLGNYSVFCSIFIEFYSILILLDKSINNKSLILSNWSHGYDYGIPCNNKNIFIFGEIKNNGYRTQVPKIGDYVKRSKHWKYEDIDGGECGVGVVKDIKEDGSIYEVQWNSTKITEDVRWNHNQCYDIEVVTVDDNMCIVGMPQVYFYSGVKIKIKDINYPVTELTNFTGTMEICLTNTVILIEGTITPDDEIEFEEKSIISGINHTIWQKRFYTSDYRSGTKYKGQLKYNDNIGYELSTEFCIPECLQGSLSGNSSDVFTFTDETSNENMIAHSHSLTMPIDRRGYSYGSHGFNNGVNYWEIRVKGSSTDVNNLGDISIGVDCVSFKTDLQKINLSEWSGYKYINYRAISYNQSEDIYGTFYMKGDTLGVLLDLNSGVLSFIYDGYKYGEHHISEFGTAYRNLGFALDDGQFYPTFGLKGTNRSLALNTKVFSLPSVSSNIKFEVVQYVTMILQYWLHKQGETLPLDFLRRSYDRYVRWAKAKYERYRIRVNGLYVDFDTSPEAFKNLNSKLRTGYIVLIKEYDDIVLEREERALIIGVYKNHIWYRLLNAEAHGAIGETSFYSWQFSPTEVQKLKILEKTTEIDYSINPLKWEEYLEINNGKFWKLDDDLELVSLINDKCLSTAQSYENLKPYQIAFESNKRKNKENQVRFTVLMELNALIELILPLVNLSNRNLRDIAVEGDPLSISILNPYPILENRSIKRTILFESRAGWKRYNLGEYLRTLKSLIFNKTKRKFLKNVLKKTSTSSRPPVDEFDTPENISKLKFNRINCQPSFLSTITDMEDRIERSLYGQLYNQLKDYIDSYFRIEYIGKGHGGQKRFFLAQLKGEGVDDYGGPYRSIYEGLMTELQYDYRRAEIDSTECILPFLIPTQNRINDTGEIGRKIKK